MRGIIPILSAIFLSLTNAASAVETDIELSYVTAVSSGSTPISLKGTIDLTNTEGKAATAIMSNFEAFLFWDNYKQTTSWESVESLIDSLKLTNKGWSIPLAFKETPTIAKMDLETLKNQPLNIIITCPLAIEGETPARKLISHNALMLSALNLSKLKAITVVRKGLSTTPYLDAPFDVVFKDANGLSLGLAQNLKHSSQNQSIINIQPFDQVGPLVHQLSNALNISNNNSQRPQDIEVSYVTSDHQKLPTQKNPGRGTWLEVPIEFYNHKVAMFFGDFRGEITNTPTWQKIRQEKQSDIVTIDLTNDKTEHSNIKINPSQMSGTVNWVFTTTIHVPHKDSEGQKFEVEFLLRHIAGTIPKDITFTKLELVYMGFNLTASPTVFFDSILYNEDKILDKKLYFLINQQ